MYLALELCAEGDLRAFLASRRGVALACSELRRCMQELLEAVAYVHSVSIVHRDIKPENILIQSTPGRDMGVLKLTDFGVAVRGGDADVPGGWGTVPYMSPEQMRGPCGRPCDVWACGAVLFELVCGEHLLPADRWDEEDLKKLSGFFQSVEFGDRLRQFDVNSASCGSPWHVGAARSFARALLHRSSVCRATAADALRCGFFVGCDCGHEGVEDVPVV